MMKTIYLVDDDEDDRMLTRQALESVTEEYAIVELSDGSQLLDLIDRGELAELGLILMDVNMPCLTGHDVLLALRNRPAGQHIPVVIFSTSNHPESVARAYQLGANAYIVKPSLLVEYRRIAYSVSLCFLNRHFSMDPLLTSQTMRSKSVMVIEDNPDHSELIEISLRQGEPRLSVIHHSRAEDVLAALQVTSDKPLPALDLILLDLYLPTRQQGLDLLTQIREAYASRNVPMVPIVVFSASDRQEDIRASYRQQANAYLVKTVELAWSCYLTDLCLFWWSIIAYPRHTE